MKAIDSTDAFDLQVRLFDFAITELVRQHRESFEPLWSLDSWVKLMIWLSLNCGCPGDEESMKRFAEAIGPTVTNQMRRVFFEREFEDFDLKLIADPADQQVLVLPMFSGVPLDLERAVKVVDCVGLRHQVVDTALWQQHDSLMAIPRVEGSR